MERITRFQVIEDFLFQWGGGVYAAREGDVLTLHEEINSEQALRHMGRLEPLPGEPKPTAYEEARRDGERLPGAGRQAMEREGVLGGR